MPEPRAAAASTIAIFRHRPTPPAQARIRRARLIPDPHTLEAERKPGPRARINAPRGARPNSGAAMPLF